MITYLREAFRELDVVYTTTAPNGSLDARQGTIVLYDNSGVYSLWINTTGSTAWEQISTQGDGSVVSTGTGTVKMANANNANSAGFLKLKKDDGTTVYIPYWTDETP